jgi:hypothetical protein
MAPQTKSARRKACHSRFLIPALLLAACGVALVGGCSQAPQLSGPDNLAAADALWTAITAKENGLLESSAAEIEELHAAQKMPEEVYAALSGVIATARHGDWSHARGTLKTLIKGQRPSTSR